VSISVSRSFWTLQDRQNVFSYKKDCSCLSRNQSKLPHSLVSELRNELQCKDALVQSTCKAKALATGAGDINVQHKKPADIPQGSLAYLEQASANIPVPLKQI
jgi:hypothetical protein